MPGPHLRCLIYQCYPDIGGSDHWVGQFYNETTEWYAGWHSTKPFHEYYLTPAWSWFLIGWEKWTKETLHQKAYMMESYYAWPGPSMSPAGADLTPQGHWFTTYNADGEVTRAKWSAEVLHFSEENAFLKGRRRCKGYGKDKGKSKVLWRGKVVTFDDTEF